MLVRLADTWSEAWTEGVGAKPRDGRRSRIEKNGRRSRIFFFMGGSGYNSSSQVRILDC